MTHLNNVKMTPCEKLGYKVGDKFKVVNNTGSCFTRGEIIELIDDDGSVFPYFVREGEEIRRCVYLYRLEKLPQVNLTTNDEVHHPQHYTDGEIECIDAIKAALSPEEYKGFLKGNAMKYIWRMNRKGKPSVDAKKALWYTDKLCDELEGNNNGI